MWENTAYDAVLIDKERITTGGNCSLLGGGRFSRINGRTLRARTWREYRDGLNRHMTGVPHYRQRRKNKKTAYYEKW